MRFTFDLTGKLMTAFVLAACAGGGGDGGAGNSDPVAKSAINGKSSVTFSGAVNRTTQYGTETNTGAYCQRYKSGDTSILLREEGENRNNYGWMKDGISFSFYRSTRPQDITEIDRARADMVAVVKEFDSDGTFQLEKNCEFRATIDGSNKMSVSFKCPELVNRYRTSQARLAVTGWIECELVEQNY